MKIVAVESVELHHQRMLFGVQLFGKLEPVAIIVISRNGIDAFDLSQNQLDLGDLIRKVPGLAVLLDFD